MILRLAKSLRDEVGALSPADFVHSEAIETLCSPYSKVKHRARLKSDAVKDVCQPQRLHEEGKKLQPARCRRERPVRRTCVEWKLPDRESPDGRTLFRLSSEQWKPPDDPQVTQQETQHEDSNKDL